MSIYATHTAKSYRVKVVLSNNTERVVVYDIYGHHPMGYKRDVVEIDGIDRDGNPATVIVPEWVLEHFLSSEGENWDLARELLGREEATKWMKEEIRKRRSGK